MYQVAWSRWQRHPQKDLQCRSWRSRRKSSDVQKRWLGRLDHFVSVIRIRLARRCLDQNEIARLHIGKVTDCSRQVEVSMDVACGSACWHTGQGTRIGKGVSIQIGFGFQLEVSRSLDGHRIGFRCASDRGGDVVLHIKRCVGLTTRHEARAKVARDGGCR